MTSKRNQISAVEAAEWWIQLRDEECSTEDKHRFADWLKASPENVREYLELAAVWDDLQAPVSEIDVNAIIAEISVTNVVQHPNYSDSATPQSIAKVRRQTHWQAIAACFALIGLAILLIIQQSDDTITTAIGEHRSIVLGDGSILTLNTRTEIRYHLDEKRRHVDLLDGEALFNIAHDPTRPFIVSAGKTKVRALGTSFNIYKKSESDATVTVLEGLVAVRQEATPATLIQQVTGGSLSETNEIQLGASEQLHISDDHLVQRETGEHVKRAVEWTSRRLSFENAALEEVVSEFNRYNAIQLKIDDEELAALRLNGVFEPHSHDVLIEYLKKTENVRTRDIGELRLISRASASHAK